MLSLTWKKKKKKFPLQEVIVIRMLYMSTLHAKYNSKCKWKKKMASKTLASSSASGKPTTCKDALKRWEEDNPGIEISSATEVTLNFQWPPIERMDNSLAVLTACEKLSLSTNMIEKVAGKEQSFDFKRISFWW